MCYNDNTSAVAEAAQAMLRTPASATSGCPVREALAALQVSHGVPIEFRHLSRNSEEGRLADAMSRRQELEWHLDYSSLAAAVESILNTLPVAAGQLATWPPDVDLLASERTHLHACRYYACMWDRRCAAANAWDLDWSRWPEEALNGQLRVFGVPLAGAGQAVPARPDGWNGSPRRKPVCYVFPYHTRNQAYHVMRKIESDQATCWLVSQEHLDPAEQLLLSRLPVQASAPLQPSAPGIPVARSLSHPCVLGSQTWVSGLALHFITWEAQASVVV